MQIIERIKNLELDIDLSGHITNVVTILYLGVPSTNSLLSLKLSTIEDEILAMGFETEAGNRAKMDIKKLSKEFFQGRGKDSVAVARVQPNATKFQDTLFFEVNVDLEADDEFISYVLSPLLILSHQVILYM